MSTLLVFSTITKITVGCEPSGAPLKLNSTTERVRQSGMRVNAARVLRVNSSSAAAGFPHSALFSL
jgi:hypothetical protein